MCEMKMSFSFCRWKISPSLYNANFSYLFEFFIKEEKNNIQMGLKGFQDSKSPFLLLHSLGNISCRCVVVCAHSSTGTRGTIVLT